MEQPLIIKSTDVDSYDKHLDLINDGYRLVGVTNADYDAYIHKDMPNLWALNLASKNLSYYSLNSEEFIFHIKNTVASFKAVKLLSAATHSILNLRTKLYELARMIAPKNHNIAIHKSIDDDNQNDGVATSFISTKMESKK